MSKSPIARRADLATALKRFKKGEQISLQDLAFLWGVSKARFVNVRNEITDFPDPVGKQGNGLLYNAREAIEALVRHDKRNDQVIASKSSKVRRILGASAADAEEDAPLPPSEMLALARAGAEVDKRLREQGTLVKFSEVQEIASEVFGELSNVLSKLSDSVDPNGRLPGTVRTLLDGQGKDLLLRMYAKLNDMLDDHVDVVPDRAVPARKRPNRPRRTTVRSKRS